MHKPAGMSTYLTRLYSSKTWRIAELLIFFILIPLISKWFITGYYIIIPLMGTAILFFALLWRDKSFDNKRFYRLSPYPWLPALLRLLLVSGLMILFAYYFYPDLLFRYPVENTQNYLLTFLLYPFLSVIPQELVYRCYFFHRYQKLIPQKWLLATANALLFGFLHIIYNNWLAPIAAFLVSWVFIYNYLKTKSLVNVCIEHYCYGVALFTIGLGKFFK